MVCASPFVFLIRYVHIKNSLRRALYRPFSAENFSRRDFEACFPFSPLNPHIPMLQ